MILKLKKLQKTLLYKFLSLLIKIYTYFSIHFKGIRSENLSKVNTLLHFKVHLSKTTSKIDLNCHSRFSFDVESLLGKINPKLLGFFRVGRFSQLSLFHRITLNFFQYSFQYSLEDLRICERICFYRGKGIEEEK